MMLFYKQENRSLGMISRKDVQLINSKARNLFLVYQMFKPVF